MPSLNLRNPLRRDPNRPTLKQRAAAIKATAGRVMRRRAIEVAPAAPGADPRLTAMVADLLEARRKLNDPSVPDGPEADALGERETDLSIAVHRFPARSIHDMAAKLPFLREEAEDAARGWDGRRVPFEASLPGAAWAGLLRDIEHLAGAAPATKAAPDPIFAAIEANREAEAQMDTFGREEDACPCVSARAARQKALAAAQVRSWKAAFETRPTTPAGMRALVDWIRWQLERHEEPTDGDGTVWADACLSLLAVVEGYGEAPVNQGAVPTADLPIRPAPVAELHNA
ncbi:UNVERIFIED_ORG: hypothetical protein J2W74_005230 [Methylorubrum zatmanii]